MAETMSLELLHKEADLDMKIDPDNLDTESINTSHILAKWLQWFSKEGYRYKQLTMQLDKKTKERYMYYKLEYDYELDKREIQMHVAADETIQHHQTLVAISKEKLDFIERVVRNLQNRNYAIKNAIDYRVFISGAK